jgi:hypothetical protein
MASSIWYTTSAYRVTVTRLVLSRYRKPMSINPGRLLSQLLEWLTVNFRLDPELFSANVHALWTNSSREFFLASKSNRTDISVGELVKRM